MAVGLLHKQTKTSIVLYNFFARLTAKIYWTIGDASTYSDNALKSERRPTSPFYVVEWTHSNWQ